MMHSIASMGTQIECRDSRQTDLLSIPLCLQPTVDEAAIVPGAGESCGLGGFVKGG